MKPLDGAASSVHCTAGYQRKRDHDHDHARTHTHVHTQRHTDTHTHIHHVSTCRKRSTQICKCTGCAPTDFLFIATIADLILIETGQKKRQITV